MKLAPLLAQYLYTQKRLDLPGLGSLMLNPSVIIETGNNKQTPLPNLEGITFEYKRSVKEDPALIQFISSQTGKIKALASADLESYLGQALQFLNIGKPFLIEGIGSLVKIKSGEFTFTPGQVIPVLLNDYSAKEISFASSAEEPVGDYKSIFYSTKKKTTPIKPMALLLLLGGLAIAIWGGYTLYKKTAAQKVPFDFAQDTLAQENNNREPVLIKDTIVHQKDSTIEPKRITVVPAGNYKLILEMSNKERAVNRLGKLKAYQWNVQMETTDSLSYKIFMLLPLAAADTSRTLDSLSRLNGRRVYIEK